MGEFGKARVRVVIRRLAADSLTTVSCTEEMCIHGLPHPHSRVRSRQHNVGAKDADDRCNVRWRYYLDIATYPWLSRFLQSSHRTRQSPPRRTIHVPNLHRCMEARTEQRCLRLRLTPPFQVERLSEVSTYQTNISIPWGLE
ncbi:hypothetical protein QBC45DRAFT_399610 [Copromyces sp. CBS 386.78]|nr:hypothetical protein QBC45DRAFT_399610 [Copromyces sp. CBS 386.78]